MKESTRQRIAFDLYWQLGPRRSLELLHQELKARAQDLGYQRTPSLASLKRWSTSLHWQDRIADLETETRELEHQRRVEEQLQMNELHIKTARAMLSPAIQRLASLDPNDIDLSSLPAWVREAVRIERLARGEPTEVTQHQGGVIHGHVDLSRFTYQELRRLADTAHRRSLGDGQEEPQ